MTLKHVVTDLHKVYLTEMEAQIKPKSTAGAGSDSKASGGSEGGTAEDQTKKAARQLAYDTRYKARRDDIPLEKAFTQTLQNSSASSPVKELAKGMLFGGGQKEEVEKISEKPELPPEIFAALRRLENKRQRQGGDKKDSPFPSDKKEKDVKKESIGTAIDKTLGAAGEVADTAIKLPVKAVGYAAGLKKGLKKQFKKGQNKANEETQQESIGSAVDKTLGAAGEVADTAIKLPVKAVGYVAGLKKGLKKQFKKGQNKANEEVSIEEAKTKAKKASGKKGKKKDKVLVTPVKGQGKQYRRYADAKKKYELRKNPQISSVTGTSYGSTYDEKPDDKKNPGKFPQQKKAKKDFDGDGKLESPKAEYKGSKDKAIKKAIKSKKNEEFSNWKESFDFDLTEITNKDSQPKKIQELKGKNTIIINPKLEEGTEILGGYVLGVDELTEQFTEESIDFAADFFIEEGINEEGLDLIIEEVGVEDFTEFVFNCNTSLLDEAVRDMQKAPKRDYAKVKASVDKKDAERKAKGTGEYSKTKAAKAKFGDEDNTNYDDDAPAPKKKGGAIVKSKSSAIVKSAAKKAKEKQPEKKPEKKGIVGKIRGAVAKGMERHKAATKAASKSLKATAKQHSQHRKDFVKGATPTAKEKKIAGGIAKGVKKAVTGEEVVHEELHPNIKKIDAMSKANVAKQAAKSAADKSAREKTAAAFQAHKKATLAKGGRPVDALDSWNKKKLNKEASVDPRGGGANPDLSVKQQNTERQQTASQREKIRRQRELIMKMRQQDVAQGRQPSGHTTREEIEIDERLGGKGYSRKAAASSVYPGKKSTGDWPDSDRGEGNKAARRAGKPVKAKSPTYIAHVKNKKANEALDLKKDDAGSAPADKKADGMNAQIERKEKKVAVMKRQILQKKVQAVRAGAGGDVVAHYEPEGEVIEAKIDDVKYGKGKGWDQPDGKSMTKYSARHSYLKKNPPNVRSDRNKRHSAVDVVFHGHDKVERDRKAKHYASKGVKKVKGAKVATGGKEALKKRFQDQGAMEATDYHRGQGEKIQKRTLEWMKKRGEKGAPGLDAMKARSAEHKAKRSVKEAYRVLAKSGSDKGKPSQFSYKDEKDAKKFADSIKKDGGRATVTKEDTVQELNRYEKETGKSSGSLNMPKGRPTQTGGTKDPVMRAVRTSIRKETGKPEGQHKKERGKKPPVAGEYGARRTPKDIVLNRRAAKARADAAMMDTRGT